MSAYLTQIKTLLVGLAEFYQREISPGQLAAYAEDLEDIEPGKLTAAIKQARRVSEFFPLPAKIRELALGSAKDEAHEAAGLIVEAMSRFGYARPDDARRFMGDLAWQVVTREGGWLSLCQRTKSDDLPILKAQWRELAASIIRRGHAGLSHAPGLPGPIPERVKALLHCNSGDSTT